MVIHRGAAAAVSTRRDQNNRFVVSCVSLSIPGIDNNMNQKLIRMPENDEKGIAISIHACTIYY